MMKVVVDDRVYEVFDASAFPLARLKTEWISLGYREYIVEDFHFAYQIYTDDASGDSYVYVHDACHSLLYHA